MGNKGALSSMYLQSWSALQTTLDKIITVRAVTVQV